MAQSTVTQTKTTSATGTAVMVATAVLVATVVGTTIGITQWQQNAALVVDDLNINGSIADATSFTDDITVFRGENAAGSTYGQAIAASGDINSDGREDLIVTDTAVETADGGRGTVYLYFGSETGPSTTPDWETFVDMSGFGYALANNCDVNADGYDDVIVSARSEGSSAQGQVLIYYGSATTPTTGDPDARLIGADGSQYFGQSLVCLSNSGHGGQDLVVYTGNYESGQSALSLYYASSSGLSATPDWIYVSGSNFFEKSVNLANLGDVNSDGYQDLGFGNPENTTPFGYGSLEVFYGSSTGFASRPDFLASTPNDDWFGATIVGDTDLNLDGYGDVIVGSPMYSNGEDNEGAMYAYFGSATGLSRRGRIKIESNLADSYLGVALAKGNNIPSTGYDGVVVTAPYSDADGDGQERGRAMVYSGSATGLQRRAVGIEGTRSDSGMDVYGISLDTASNLAGTTGAVDIVVGIENYDDDIASGPAVLVYSDVSL